MAEIGIIEKFKAAHGSNLHEHNFKAEVVLEGKIDLETGFVAGVDHYQLISDVKKITEELADKNLKEMLSALGFKTSGNESIAILFINKLKEKYPIKFVRVWETEERYATVFANEI